ncbi:MAG TPA: glycosyltransferase [Candidatus Latescibacteria bacterium]|nr:glycosyltransferase [Candidatus Latescibacterota bacterium]HJP29589.1 glycosyltransferase [Candidatus Latescibacterota bacterium]
MIETAVSVAEAVFAVSTTTYVAGLLWFLRGARRAESSPEAGSAPTIPPTLPAVAVVVAARNEVNHVEACLRSLSAQTFPADRYEVVLVDDGSTDGTGELARTVAAELCRSGSRIRVLDGPSTYGAGGSKKAALGSGIAGSSGELVLTTDADCAVPAGWVQSMVDHFSPETGAVIGFSQIGEPGAAASRLARWEGLDFLQLMTAAAGSCVQGHPMAASGQSLAFRRQAFEEVGGYGPVQHRVSGDDVLLLQLIRGTGRWKISFCGEEAGRVVHPPSTDLRSFLSRRARWASNAPMQLRLDPLFFLFMVATFTTSIALLIGPILWAMGSVSAGFSLTMWSTKITAELALAARGARRFGRADLLGAFPCWTVLQPFYTVVVGVVGPFGFFRWKGRRVALGEARTARL